MYFDNKNFYFADSVEEHYFNYIASRFNINFEKDIDAKRIENYARLITYLWLTKYDIHIFCYECEYKFCCNPLDLKVRLLKKYNQCWHKARSEKKNDN